MIAWPPGAIFSLFPLNNGLSGHQTQLPGTGFRAGTSSFLIPSPNPCGSKEAFLPSSQEHLDLQENSEHSLSQCWSNHPASPEPGSSKTLSPPQPAGLFNLILSTTYRFISKYFNMYFFKIRVLFFFFVLSTTTKPLPHLEVIINNSLSNRAEQL